MKAILALALGFAAMAVAAPVAEPVAEAEAAPVAAPEADLDKRFYYTNYDAYDFPSASKFGKRFYYTRYEANAPRDLEKRFYYTRYDASAPQDLEKRIFAYDEYDATHQVKQPSSGYNSHGRGEYNPTIHYNGRRHH